MVKPVQVVANADQVAPVLVEYVKAVVLNKIKIKK